MGNDLISYRASIGSFHAKINSALYKNYKRQRSCLLFVLSAILLSILFSNITVIMFIYFCLIRSGDIELNPGPSTNDKITFCCINCRSLLSNEDKFSSLQALAETNNYSIIALTETWFNDNTTDDVLAISGYNIFRKDRIGARAGGVAIYIKSDLIASRFEIIDCNLTEIIWLKITYKLGVLAFGVCYCPQTISESVENAEHFINYLDSVVDVLNDHRTIGFILTGDFNAKDPRLGFSDRSNPLGRKLYNFITLHNVSQLINEPTRIAGPSQSLLDLILTDVPQSITDCGTLPPLHQSCDHAIIQGVYCLPRKQNLSYFKEFYCLKNVDWVALNTSLRSAEWAACYSNTNNPDIVFDRWFSLFNTTIKNHIPFKRLKINARDKSWVTPLVKHCINKRKRLYKKALHDNSQEAWDSFNNADYEYSHSIRKAKSDYFQHLFSSLNDSNLCKKKWWHLVKNVYGNTKESTIPNLLVNDSVIEDTIDKCKLFNEYFADQTSLDDSNATLPVLNIQAPRLEIPPLLPETIAKVLKSLNTSKSTGPDGISNELLRNISAGISNALCDLFNYSLTCGVFPKNWKIANVTPLFKKGDRSVLSSYRPISLLSCLSKVFERVVADLLVEHLKRNNLISNKQAGFVPGDSTINQLIILTDTILTAFENGKEAHAVFLDISKAFDRVWHRGLIHKLKSFGINGTLLEWFTSYLIGRKQRVVINGASSDYLYIQAGVPQGSVLGPILFIMYINDLSNEIVSDLFLFADDGTLVDVFSDNRLSIQKLNMDLLQIEKWSKIWLVNFNALKTVAMTFSCKRIPSCADGLRFFNQAIKTVTSHKHLGIFLNHRLDWQTHFEFITSKCLKRLNLLRRIKKRIPREALRTLYITMIRSIMEYGLVIFHCNNNVLISHLESIQYKACLIICGALRLTSYQNMLHELGLSKLSERADFLKVTLFYKAVNNLSSQFFCSYVIKKCTRVNSVPGLRNAQNLLPPLCRTERYANAFIPYTCKQWKSLDPSLTASPSLVSFKAKYKKLLFNRQTFGYNYGQKVQNILHTRFRLNFTTLNNDLYMRSLINTPNCSCGRESESYSHYFLRCPLFTNPRHLFFNELHSLFEETGVNILAFREDILIEHFLFGFKFEFKKYNLLLFKAIQNYITSTNRFN